MEAWQLVLISSIIILTLYFSHQGSLSTQIIWNKPQSWNEGLPSSIEVFQTNSSYEGLILMTAAYCQFDLSDPDLEFKILFTNDGTGKNLSQFILEEPHLVYMISNAGYFSTPSYASMSLIIENKTTLATNVLVMKLPFNNSTAYYYPTRGAFGIYANGSAEVSWVYNLNGDFSQVYSYPEPSPNNYNTTSPQPIPSTSFPPGGAQWQIDQAIGGDPVLIKNGQLNITTAAEFTSSHIADYRNPRTAICVTHDNKFIAIVVDGRYPLSQGLFLQELADIMMEIGCKDAINLDGGGSTAMIVNGYLTNRPSDPTGERLVPSVLMLVSRSKPNPEFQAIIKERNS